MDSAATAAIVFGLAATLLFAAIYLLRAETRIRRDEKILTERKYLYTSEDYRADMKCDICFDDIGEEKVSECTCGKVFHLSCAEPTGECPYCGAPFGSFAEPREPKHVICPRCGNIMNGNICSCGTIVPDRDGTFLCRCGERVSTDEKMCMKCGRTFGSSVYKVSKEFIPSK